MIYWGLCCLFKNEAIKFRRISAAQLNKISTRQEQLKKLGEIIQYNADSLSASLKTCLHLGISGFRINSELMPLATHPTVGYQVGDLPNIEEIITTLDNAKQYAQEHHIRLSFHPDQFVVLNSNRPEVVASSLAELKHQSMMAELCGVNEINIHGGGVYGDKKSALLRLEAQIYALPDNIKTRLTLENDDKSYTVKDLLPLCEKLAIPLVYDIHHHRLNPDNLSIEMATELVIKTWHCKGVIPRFHLSSSPEGCKNNSHANEIYLKDFPLQWLNFDLLIDVEAKNKEVAIIELRRKLEDVTEILT